MNSSERAISLTYHVRERRVPGGWSSWIVIANAYLLPVLTWFAVVLALQLLFRVHTGKWELNSIYILGNYWTAQFRLWVESVVPTAAFLIPIGNFVVASFLRGRLEISSVAMWLAGLAILLVGVIFNVLAIVFVEMECL